MSTSFADLLKNRKKASQELDKKLAETANNGYASREADPRLWTGLSHCKNEDGNGRATIRFLPTPPNGSNGIDEVSPFVLYYSYFHRHHPQGAAKPRYYVAKSLKTFGNDEPDPAYNYNGTIYSDQSLSDDDKKKRAIRRQKKYVSNILVIDDPAQPQNNGKVFLFEYGPAIFKLIQDARKPDPAVSDLEAFDPFDPIEGRPLKIKVVSKKIDNQLVPQYDQSSWGEIAPIADDESEMEAIWRKEYPLAGEFLDRSKFEPIEKQIKDFKRCFGFYIDGNGKRVSGETSVKSDDIDHGVSEPKKQKETAFKDAMDDDIPDFSSKESRESEKNDGDKPFFDEDDDDSDDFFSRFK